jgi:hypothetical protein
MPDKCDCIVGLASSCDLPTFVKESNEQEVPHDDWTIQFKHCPCCGKNLITYRDCAVLDCGFTDR